MLKNRLTGIIDCTSLSSLVLGYSMPSINVNADLDPREIINLCYFTDNMVNDMIKDDLRLKEIFLKKDNAKKNSGNSENKEEEESENKIEEEKEKKESKNKIENLKENLAILCEKLSMDSNFAPYAYEAGKLVYEIEKEKWENEDFFVKVGELLCGIFEKINHERYKNDYKYNPENILRFEKVSMLEQEDKNIKTTYTIYESSGRHFPPIAGQGSRYIVVIEERISPEGTIFGEKIKDLVHRVRTLSLDDIKTEAEDDILLDLKNPKMCTNMGWKGKIKVDLPESNKIIEEDYPNNVKLACPEENIPKEKIDCSPQCLLKCGLSSFRVELSNNKDGQLIGKSNMEITVAENFSFSGKINLNIVLKQKEKNKFHGISKVKEIKLESSEHSMEGSYQLQVDLQIERSDDNKDEWDCKLKVALADKNKIGRNKFLDKIGERLRFNNLFLGEPHYVALFNKNKKLFNYSGHDEKKIDDLFLDRINCAISKNDLENIYKCFALNLEELKKLEKEFGNSVKFRRISETLDSLHSKEKEIYIWHGVKDGEEYNFSDDFSILEPIKGFNVYRLRNATFYSFAPGLLSCSAVIGAMVPNTSWLYAFEHMRGFEFDGDHRAVLSINTVPMFDKLLKAIDQKKEEEKQKKNANIKTKNDCVVF